MHVLPSSIAILKLQKKCIMAAFLDLFYLKNALDVMRFRVLCMKKIKTIIC